MLTILKVVLVFVEVLVSLLLIGAILIQRTKGQGMGLAFGSSMGESLFGTQVGNVLTRATVILGIVFLINTTLLALLQSGRGVVSVTDTLPLSGVAPAAASGTQGMQPMPQESAPLEPAPVFDMNMAPQAAPAEVPAAAPVEPAPAPVEALPAPAGN